MCIRKACVKSDDFIDFVHKKDLEMKKKLIETEQQLKENENINSQQNININIRLSHGNYVQININQCETIQTLKTKIYHETGISEKTYSLYFNQIRLENENDIQSYSIENNSRIYMIRDYSIYFDEYIHKH